MEPWNFCKEAGIVMEGMSITDLALATTFMDKVTNSCANRLPEIHGLIIQGTTQIQVEDCCGIDPCQLLYNIEILRPVTAANLIDPTWQTSFETTVNDPLCCVIRVLNEDEIKSDNTFGNITEIPNFTIAGLPGFTYPNYRCPPLVRMHRPVNTDIKALYPSVDGGGVSTTHAPSGTGDGTIGSGAGDGIGAAMGYNPCSGGIGLSGNIDMSFNVDGISEVFGISNQMFMNFANSPLEFLYDFLCGGKTFSVTGGVNARASISVVLPNLSFTPHIEMHIDPCLSQFLPPMALPTIELSTMTLGGGAEFGIFANSNLLSSNFGTAFGADGGIGSLSAGVDASASISIPSVDTKHGMNADVTFPSYGQGREWSEH